MTGQEYSMIGILIIAVGALWKLWLNSYNRNEKDRKETLNKLLSNHEKEEQRLIDEYKELKIEVKEERKEYLKRLDKFDLSLNENTKVLKEVAGSVKEIKGIREDVDNLQEDVSFIKESILNKSVG